MNNWSTRQSAPPAPESQPRHLEDAADPDLDPDPDSDPDSDPDRDPDRDRDREPAGDQAADGTGVGEAPRGVLSAVSASGGAALSAGSAESAATAGRDGGELPTEMARSACSETRSSGESTPVRSLRNER